MVSFHLSEKFSSGTKNPIQTKTLLVVGNVFFSGIGGEGGKLITLNIYKHSVKIKILSVSSNLPNSKFTFILLINCVQIQSIRLHNLTINNRIFHELDWEKGRKSRSFLKS